MLVRLDDVVATSTAGDLGVNQVSGSVAVAFRAAYDG